MNKPCARCNKTVYPVEKLTCLDKTWHKACFNCEVCHLKLTMKTYKGYNKLPYCVPHYPTTKFTAVADTPENKRLAKQQMNQSELVYRKDKETALKGFTQVADTVAVRQAAHSGKLASNLNYQTAPHQVGREGLPPADEIVNRPNNGQQQQAPAPVAAAPQAPPPASASVAPVPAPAPPSYTGQKYVAMYDYAAADDDEVTFTEGDVIINGTVIDEGWMEGTVERTGAHGMLPSNYVSPV